MSLGKTQLCLHCEYDLLGSPEVGQCPECGHEYNKRTNQGVQSGSADHIRRGDRLMARLRTIFLVFAAVVVMSCGGLLARVAQKPLKPVVMAGLVAGVLILAAVVSYMGEKET